jgi:hypothetical protein
VLKFPFHSPYAYAGNPVSFVDPDVEFVLEAMLVSAMIWAFTGSVSAGMQNRDPYLGMLKGAVIGAASYTAVVLVTPIAIGAAGLET